jgi:hypothetical protein
MRRTHDIWPWYDSCSPISTKTSVSREARGECVDILEVVVTCGIEGYAAKTEISHLNTPYPTQPSHQRFL